MTKAPCRRRAGELNFVQKFDVSRCGSALFLGHRHVDLVTGGFNGAAWRRQCGNDRKFAIIIGEAVAETDLPMPPVPPPLWEPGGVPGEWSDVRPSFNDLMRPGHPFVFLLPLCFCNSCHCMSQRTCPHAPWWKNKDCLILGIKIRCKDEGRVLCTRIGTASWEDWVAVKDGERRTS